MGKNNNSFKSSWKNVLVSKYNLDAIERKNTLRKYQNRKKIINEMSSYLHHFYVSPSLISVLLRWHDCFYSDKALQSFDIFHNNFFLSLSHSLFLTFFRDGWEKRKLLSFHWKVGFLWCGWFILLMRYQRVWSKGDLQNTT